MSRFYQSMLQSDTPRIPFIELDDASFVTNNASVAKLQILMNLILNIYIKASKFGNTNFVVNIKQQSHMYLADSNIHCQTFS